MFHSNVLNNPWVSSVFSVHIGAGLLLCEERCSGSAGTTREIKHGWESPEDLYTEARENGKIHGWFPEGIIAGAFTRVVRFTSQLSEGVVAKVGRTIQSNKC